MRKVLSAKLENGRITQGPYGSDASFGPYGAFLILGPTAATLKIVSSAGDETGWEHVSVSCKNRTPNWVEMCFIKDLFWAEDECVIQYHPPKSEYVNNHEYCLHMWRPTREAIPMPPSIMVGVQGVSSDEIKKLVKG